MPKLSQGWVPALEAAGWRVLKPGSGVAGWDWVKQVLYLSLELQESLRPELAPSRQVHCRLPTFPASKHGPTGLPFRTGLSLSGFQINLYFSLFSLPTPSPLSPFFPSLPCMNSVHGEGRGQRQVSSFIFSTLLFEARSHRTQLYLASSGDGPAFLPLLQQHWSWRLTLLLDLPFKWVLGSKLRLLQLAQLA